MGSFEEKVKVMPRAKLDMNNERGIIEVDVLGHKAEIIFSIKDLQYNPERGKYQITFEIGDVKNQGKVRLTLTN